MGNYATPHVRIELPEPLLSLTRVCEVHCVADCCGVDAFDASAEHMVPWVHERGPSAAERAVSQLDALITFATEQPAAREILSGDFNALWTPAACADYLRLWHRELTRARSIAAATPHE